MNSWGFIEVIGYTPAIASADAMIKSAEVQLVGIEVIGGAMVTVAVKGNVAAIRTAIDAGAEAAKKYGQLHCAQIIARPKKDAQKVLAFSMEE
jgi:ethanolamine utilization protein EutM